MTGGDGVFLGGAIAAPMILGLGVFFFLRSGRCRAVSKSTKHKALDPAPISVSWLRLVAGNLLILGFLLSSVFLAGELFFRFGRDTTDSFSLSRNSRRWFERHWQTNRAGVRDNIEYTWQIPRGLRRVTFLGDSFTAGHGVADVQDRFANRIRRARGDRWDVHALAAPGLDTGDEIEHLERFVASGYRLDVLVLVYCLNDISDLMPGWRDIMERIHRNGEQENRLVRHSFVLNALYYRLRAAHDPDVSNYYGFVRQAYDGPLWQQQKKRLESLAAFCQSRHVRLLVVTFPFLHALQPDYAYGDVHERLGRFWQSVAVPHLDLLDTFAGSVSSEVTVGRFDAHPNAQAHRLAADAILGFLDRQFGGPTEKTP